MHPALRKGPLFYQKTPPIVHFFNKKTSSRFISCLGAWAPPVREGSTGRIYKLRCCVSTVGTTSCDDALCTSGPTGPTDDVRRVCTQ